MVPTPLKNAQIRTVNSRYRAVKEEVSSLVRIILCLCNFFVCYHQVVILQFVLLKNKNSDLDFFYKKFCSQEAHKQNVKERMDSNWDCKITYLIFSIEFKPNGSVLASQVFSTANGKKRLSFISVFFICISLLIPQSVNMPHFLMICQRKAGQSVCQRMEK